MANLTEGLEWATNNTEIILMTIIILIVLGLGAAAIIKFLKK